MSASTPVSLLERLCRQPSPESWEKLVRLYTPLLQGWLRRYRLRPQDADDLVQDVLAVLVRRLPEFEHRGRPGAFRAWLRTILVNQLRNFRRKVQGQPVGGED